MAFHSIQGQAHAIEAIRRALVGGRLHHAYLFAGPEGVGKATTGRAFAKVLLCVDPSQTHDACGVCGACIRVHDSQHADLHIIERKSKSDGVLERNIKIDQVRSLQKSLSYKAYEGGRRVILLLEPERMNPSTANALLKTLEEPGRNTHFILVSDNAHRLLPTVISRCQRIRFGPLTDETVTRLIREQVEVNDIALATIARLAEGSVGRALSLIQDDVLAIRSELLAQLDQDSAQPLAMTLDLAEDLAKPDRRAGLIQVFHILRTWYRDLLVVKITVGHAHVLNTDQVERLIFRARSLTVSEIQKRLHEVNVAESAIFERMSNTRMVLESLFVSLTGHYGSEGSI
jgi:DNA polymerase-3 subunit delta'